jgi:membrane fusion protein, multidrug efflux system
MLIASKTRNQASATEQHLSANYACAVFIPCKNSGTTESARCRWQHRRGSWSYQATLSLVLCAGMLLTACQRQPKAPAAPSLPEVSVVTVTRQPVLLTIELPGRTCPFRIAEIRPQVNGLIQKRLFTEGSEVKAGQDLYQIDPAPFQAALDNATAALGRAEANLPAIQSRVKRYQEALADKAVSQQDFEDASAALKQSEADINYYKATVQSARINLNYARVVSPISGRIGTSSVTDGAIVTAYQPVALATIQQLDPIYVDVPQSATALLRLQKRLEAGQLKCDGTNASTVRLVMPDGSTYPLEGTLQFRDISVDPTTGSVTLRMIFPNPKGVLLPGMFVRGVLQEGVNEQGILIPQQTVARDTKGNPVAMIVDKEGKVQQRQLVVERTIGDQWLVTSGLEPGDLVIAEGMQKVRPGAAVKQVPFEAGTKPSREPPVKTTQTASTSN